MKQLFLVNPDTLSMRLGLLIKAMGGVLSKDQHHILLELEMTSSNLPCISSSRGDSGFSMSKHTLFWGLQWIGSLDWTTYNESDVPFLTFASSEASINCLEAKTSMSLKLPAILPNIKESLIKKPQHTIDKLNYSDASFSFFSRAKQDTTDVPTSPNKKMKSEHA